MGSGASTKRGPPISIQMCHALHMKIVVITYIPLRSSLQQTTGVNRRRVKHNHMTRQKLALMQK